MNRQITHRKTKPEITSTIELTKSDVLIAVKNMLESEGYKVEGRLYLTPPDSNSICRRDSYIFGAENDGLEPAITVTEVKLHE